MLLRFPLTPTPSPRKEGKGKTPLLSPSLLCNQQGCPGEGLSLASERGVGDAYGAPPLADFGSIVLWSASVTQNPGDLYPVLTLDWEARKPLPSTPFVHVFCNGALASQADGPPLGGLHPFDRWQPGERWADHRELHRLCSIEVGLYNASTGERYKAQLADGSTTDSVAVPLR